jgi:hypothetical protein
MAKKDIVPRAPGPAKATRAEMLLQSWLASLPSQQTRTNFKTTAERFLEALRPFGLRNAAVEEVREAVDEITEGRGAAMARQYE